VELSRYLSGILSFKSELLAKRLDLSQVKELMIYRCNK
jgi:hypothetical protein